MENAAPVGQLKSRKMTARRASKDKPCWPGELTAFAFVLPP
jgi:hypothetical protein